MENRVLKEMAAARAFIRGRLARQNGAAPSCNEFEEGTPEHAEWLKGWRARDAEICADELKRQRSMKVCTYSRTEPRAACTCGGIGLCLDVA
jgi:hypothetical protein